MICPNCSEHDTYIVCADGLKPEYAYRKFYCGRCGYIGVETSKLNWSNSKKMSDTLYLRCSFIATKIARYEQLPSGSPEIWHIVTDDTDYAYSIGAYSRMISALTNTYGVLQEELLNVESGVFVDLKQHLWVKSELTEYGYEIIECKLEVSGE